MSSVELKTYQAEELDQPAEVVEVAETPKMPDDLDTMFAELESELSQSDEEPEPTVEEVTLEQPEAVEEEPELIIDEVALEQPEPVAEEPQPAVEEEPSEEELVRLGNQMNLDEARRAAMKEMEELGSEPLPDESSLVVAPNLNVSSETMDLVKAPDRKGAGGFKRSVRTGDTTKSGSIRSMLGSKVLDYTLFTQPELLGDDADIQARSEANLAMIDALPIKVGEKAVNLISCLARSASLSNYTRMALDIFVTTGELTSKGLKDAYLKRPYSEGTANSQTTQLMKLLPALGVALRSGGKLVKNPDSTLLPMIEAMFSKTA